MDQEYNDGETIIVDSLTLPATGPEEVKKDYIPEGFDTKEEYLEAMRSDYENDTTEDQDNRDEAIDDKNFAAGNQWDPIVLEQRKGLPCLVLNTIPQFTAQVVGDWRSNRNGIKVVPAENGDVDVASVRGDLVRAIELKSRASRVYDNAFESTVVCGDGAFRIAVEYAREDVFDQEIFIRPIEDALSVVWDRMSVDPTGRDATHCFVDDMLPRKEFERRWPNADPSTLSSTSKRSLRTQGWIDTDAVRVTEHWRMIERPRLLGLFGDGSIHAIEGDYGMLMQKHGGLVKTRMAKCSYAQMHLVSGFEILAGPFEYKLNRLPIIRMSGRVTNIGGKRVRHGLVRFMKDPVRLRNFWRSVAAEQLGYAPKAQWLATESAVEGREDAFRRAHMSRDPLLTVNDEAIIGQNIQRIDPPQIQMALLNEAQINAQDMKDVTGIHDASLGIKSNETSGRAIMARQREGDIANLTYHDNGNAAILEAGDVVNQLIPQIYDSTRVVRIIGQDEEAKFVRINDPMDPKSVNLATGMYDVALDSGTSYMTRRVEAGQAMMDAIQVYPELMQIAGDLVVKAQDWPGAQELAERLKKTIPPQFLDEDEQGGAPQQQGIPPEAMQKMQEEFAKVQEQLQQLEIANATLKADQENKAKELEIKAFDAKTKRMQVLASAHLEAHELDIEAEQADRQFDQDVSANDREFDRRVEHEDRQFDHQVKQDNKPQPAPKKTK